MTMSTQAMRSAILARLYDHLQENYSIAWSKELFRDGGLSVHDIDAVLSFKSDPRLDELRNALDRLEVGTFGVCISCKRDIAEDVLQSNPTQRICAECERRYSRVDFRRYHRSVTV
jgi:hypothetical protein